MLKVAIFVLLAVAYGEQATNEEELDFIIDQIFHPKGQGGEGSKGITEATGNKGNQRTTIGPGVTTTSGQASGGEDVDSLIESIFHPKGQGGEGSKGTTVATANKGNQRTTIVPGVTTTNGGQASGGQNFGLEDSLIELVFGSKGQGAGGSTGDAGTNSFDFQVTEAMGNKGHQPTTTVPVVTSSDDVLCTTNCGPMDEDQILIDIHT